MGKYIDAVFNWLLTSSANPAAVSLTVKGFLTAGSAAIIPILGLTHVNLGSDQINSIIDSIGLVIQDGLVLVGAIGTVVGLVRKVYLSLTGGIVPTPSSADPA